MSIEAVEQGPLESQPGMFEEIVATTSSHAAPFPFARRHPLVTFLLLPVPALLVSWTCYTLALIGILRLFNDYRSVDWAVTAAGVLIHGLAYVPALALILLIVWLAIRSRTRLVWWVVASALVAFLSSLMIIDFRMPTTPGTGALQVGFGFPPKLDCWPQFAVPLLAAFLLGAYFLRKRP